MSSRHKVYVLSRAAPVYWTGTRTCANPFSTTSNRRVVCSSHSSANTVRRSAIISVDRRLPRQVPLDPLHCCH